MNRHSFTNVLFSATLLAAIPGMARGQQCPDWSPEFNQIDDPVALQQLESERSEDWPNLNPQMNGGISIQQGIQSLDQAIQQYQQELQQAQQAWLATRSSSAPMPKMNGTECRSSNNMGAAMAAACEVDNMHNAILAAQGTIDLARCRAGMPAVSHSSFDSMGSGTSYPGGGFGSYAASFESGAASEAGSNVSKRSGMVNSVTKSWKPPAEQQQAQDSLAQSAALADPFADPESNSGATSASSSAASSDAFIATSASTTSSIQTSDSSAADSGTGNNATSTTAVAAAMPPQAETSEVPDSGYANTAESSVTPVAQVPEVSNSSEIANSDVNSPGASTGGTNAPKIADSAITNSPATDSDATSQTLDQGSANAASTEVSATPVAGPSNWSRFADSENKGDSMSSLTIAANQATDSASSTLSPSAPTDAGDEQQLDRVKEIIDADKKALNSLDIFNTNEASAQIVDQGEDTVLSVAHQNNSLINDMGGALQGNVPSSQLDSDLNHYPRSMIEAAMPGEAKSLEQGYNTFQQATNSASNWVEAKGGFLYNLISGRWICNNPVFTHDPECTH